LVRLAPPDLNIVNWMMTHPALRTLAEANAFNDAIHARLSPGAADPPYFITRTRLASPAHDGVMEPLLKQLDVDVSEWRNEGLVVLRAVVMDPFLGDASAGPDHVAGFVAALRSAAADVLPLAVTSSTSALRVRC
jgi:hypothetical protein